MFPLLYEKLLEILHADFLDFKDAVFVEQLLNFVVSKPEVEDPGCEELAGVEAFDGSVTVLLDEDVEIKTCTKL
jgi:hypothetical protein